MKRSFFGINTRYNFKKPTDTHRPLRSVYAFVRCGLLQLVEPCDPRHCVRKREFANEPYAIRGAHQLTRESHWTNTAFETESQSGEFPKTLDGGLLSSIWHSRQQAMLLSGNSGFTLFHSSLYWTTLSR